MKENQIQNSRSLKWESNGELAQKDLSELIENDFAPETDKETIDAYKQCNKVSEWINHIETKRGYHAKV